MGCTDAIKSVLSKYFDFSGRVCRSEYWYWVLFVSIASICLSILDGAMFPLNEWSLLSSVFSLATLLPELAVSARWLHDIDKSAWWLLPSFVPVIGWILLLVWAVFEGTEGDNRFGPDPLAGVFGADSGSVVQA